MSAFPKARAGWYICIGLAVLTALAYVRVFWCDFVVLDDPFYVYLNPHVLSGLSADNVTWAFTSRYSGNWHPLTWISHAIDVDLFGVTPAGPHAVNLLLHMVNTVLVFQLLRRMTGAMWRSAFVAALFAVHPLHVESVAWISERKDVLSALFWALTLLAYVRFAEKPGVPRYLLVALLFALGLMAKPMLVTLPCVLLLLDVWPLKRVPARLQIEGREFVLRAQDESRFPAVSARQLLLEKVPLLALSAVSSLITLWAQAEAMAPTQVVPVWFRIVNAIGSYGRYLWKTVVPANLYVTYPIHSWSVWPVLVVLVFLVWVSYAAVRQVRTRGYLFAGWFWFLGTLVPAIGLVQVGSQSMADRYMYIPAIGLFMIVAWGGYALASRCKLGAPAIGSIAALVVVGCVAFTVRQVGYWRNSFVLFEHALQHDPQNYLAEIDLAGAYARVQRFDEACAHYDKAAKLAPALAEPLVSMGMLRTDQGNLADAVSAFEQALGREPQSWKAHYGIGVALARQRRLPEAAQHLSRACRAVPGMMQIHNELGMVYFILGQPDAAAREFAVAAKLAPGEPQVQRRLASALDASGRSEEAIALYRQLLSLQPQSFEVMNDLAWILASNPDPKLRNGDEAVRLASQACQFTGFQYPLLVGTLAAAHAEAGNFETAIQFAQKAQSLASAMGKTALAEKNAKMAALFGNHQPFREPPHPAGSIP